MKTLSTTSLTELITLIKNNFFRKSEGQEVSTLSIDSIPTSNSSNLVTSGGVYNAIPTALSQLSADSTHRLVSDTEKSTWNGKQNALGYTPYNATNPSGYQTAAQVSSAVASGVSGKQDTISDLETIRSGASAGATAYQKPSSGIPTNDIEAGAVSTSKLSDGAVTAAKIAANAVSTVYTATIPHTAWGAIESNGSTYASVSVPGILGIDSPIIDLKVMDITGVANRIKANEAWCAVFQASTASAGDSIGFRATEIPEMDLPIQILCIRK